MTKTVTVHDAETQLRELLSFAKEGNEVIIINDDKPLARIVPSLSTDRPRVAGLSKRKFWVSDDFDTPLPNEFWMDPK